MITPDAPARPSSARWRPTPVMPCTRYCYIPEFGTAVRLLRDYDGDIWRWWDDFRSRVSFTREADDHLLMILGVSACFSAARTARSELPFDPRTGMLRARHLGSSGWTGTRSGWRRGTRARCGRCGRSGSTRAPRDDFFLDLGAEAFRVALHEAGVADEVIRFELFDATHAGIDYRYPLSLAWLCQRIAWLTGDIRAGSRLAGPP